MWRWVVSAFANRVRWIFGDSITYETGVWVERICVAGIGFQSVVCVTIVSALLQYNKSDSPFKLIEIYDMFAAASLSLLCSIMIYVRASVYNRNMRERFREERWYSGDWRVVLNYAALVIAIGALMFFTTSALTEKMLTVACREIEPGDQPAGSSFCPQSPGPAPVHPLERRPVPILVPTP